MSPFQGVFLFYKEKRDFTKFERIAKILLEKINLGIWY